MSETEHKYDVENDFVLPDLAGIEDVAEVSDPAVHLLQATYFDTPDHRWLLPVSACDGAPAVTTRDGT